MASLAQMGRRIATPVFTAQVGPTHFAPLPLDAPGHHMQQKSRVLNAQSKIDTALRVAYSTREEQIREHGLAHMEDRTVEAADLINPLQMMLPPVIAAAFDGASALGYWKADRRKPANDLTKKQQDAILRPLKEKPEMKILFGQRAHVNDAMTNLSIREQKGLPRTRRVAAAAIQQGVVEWIFRPGAPAPAFI